MQRFVKCGILFLSLGASTLAFSDVTLQSRNMPTQCEFVYSVDSEIKIEWEAGIEGARLQYDVFDEYEDVWRAMPWQPLECDEIEGCSIQLAFQSMSTAEHFLYRTIRFRFLNAERIPLSGHYQATFGRAFGERCYENRNETPFRKRDVFAVDPNPAGEER